MSFPFIDFMAGKPQEIINKDIQKCCLLKPKNFSTLDPKTLMNSHCSKN